MPDVREKLVELLGNLFCGYYGMNGCDSCEYNTEAQCNAYACADRMIANNITIQRWIPVTERYPDLELEEVITNDKELFPCLVVRKNPRAKKGKYVAKAWYDGFGFLNGDSVDVTDEVTHWMEMPELPKMEV